MVRYTICCNIYILYTADMYIAYIYIHTFICNIKEISPNWNWFCVQRSDAVKILNENWCRENLSEWWQATDSGLPLALPQPYPAPSPFTPLCISSCVLIRLSHRFILPVYSYRISNEYIYNTIYVCMYDIFMAISVAL